MPILKSHSASAPKIGKSFPMLIIIPAAGITAITTINTLPSFCRKSKTLVKFSYNFKTSGVTSGCTLTLALVGTQSAIVTGFETSKANYATTDIVADSYTFTGSSWGKAVLDGTNLATIASGTLYHVEGDISWDETLSKFVLKLALDSIEVTQKIDPATGDLISSTITQTPRGSATVTLNNYIDINTLIVSSSAPTNKYSELQNIELTWGHIAIPEPSAFGLMAGLGALALAGTRRRRK